MKQYLNVLIIAIFGGVTPASRAQDGLEHIPAVWFVDDLEPAPTAMNSYSIFALQQHYVALQLNDFWGVRGSEARMVAISRESRDDWKEIPVDFAIQVGAPPLSRSHYVLTGIELTVPSVWYHMILMNQKDFYDTGGSDSKRSEDSGRRLTDKVLRLSVADYADSREKEYDGSIGLDIKREIVRRAPEKSAKIVCERRIDPNLGGRIENAFHTGMKRVRYNGRFIEPPDLYSSAHVHDYTASFSTHQREGYAGESLVVGSRPDLLFHLGLLAQKYCLTGRPSDLEDLTRQLNMLEKRLPKNSPDLPYKNAFVSDRDLDY